MDPALQAMLTETVSLQSVRGKISTASPAMAQP